MLHLVEDWLTRDPDDTVPSHNCLRWLLCLRDAWAETTRAWSSDQVDRAHLPPPHNQISFSLESPASIATVPSGYRRLCPFPLSLSPSYIQLVPGEQTCFKFSVVFCSPAGQHSALDTLSQPTCCWPASSFQYRARVGFMMLQS